MCKRLYCPRTAAAAEAIRQCACKQAHRGTEVLCDTHEIKELQVTKCVAQLKFRALLCVLRTSQQRYLAIVYRAEVPLSEGKTDVLVKRHVMSQRCHQRAESTLIITVLWPCCCCRRLEKLQTSFVFAWAGKRVLMLGDYAFHRIAKHGHKHR